MILFEIADDTTLKDMEDLVTDYGHLIKEVNLNAL